MGYKNTIICGKIVLSVKACAHGGIPYYLGADLIPENV
jgi:hypothetical protein